MTVVCPRLNPFASDPIVITSLNQYELRLSTYDRTPGTEVTLTCVDDLQIQGQSVITCQDDGNWNFESRPYCAKPSMYEYPTADDPVNSDLPENAKILIGVLVAVTLIVTIILVYFSCLIRRKMKELQRHQRLREDFSPADHDNKRNGGSLFMNNIARGQQALYDYDYMDISGNDSYVNDNRNNSTARSLASSSKRDPTAQRSNSKRDTNTRNSPKPKIKLTNNRQKVRRHSEILRTKNNNSNQDGQTTLTDKDRDTSKVFLNVNLGLRGDSKRLNGKRQRSLSEEGRRDTELTVPSVSPDNSKINKGGNQTSSIAPIFAISGRTNDSLHRGSISLGEEDHRHTDLTEINTDAMSYGRDPFLWKSVPRDWNSH